MNALDDAIEHLAIVRAHMRQAWCRASDAERGAIEADEHRVSRSLQLLTEVQQKQAQRRHGVPGRVP